jgi:hypothetical protein
VTTPVYNHQPDSSFQSKARDLSPIRIQSSSIWIRYQIFLSVCFLNLGFFSFYPYLQVYCEFFQPWVEYAVCLLINFACAMFFRIRDKNKNLSLVLSIKNGIALLEMPHRKYYCEIKSDIICWQWLVIIPLYSAETGRTFRLVIASDSLKAEDNARLRRWIVSECY